MNKNKLLINGYSENSHDIFILGFKHSIAPIFCASIICHNRINISNVPNISKIEVFEEIFDILKIQFKYKNSSVYINSENSSLSLIPDECTSKIHGSVYLIPALISKFNKVNFEESGGCQIGEKDRKRPIKHMLKIIKEFGENICIDNNKIIGECNDIIGCERYIRLSV